MPTAKTQPKKIPQGSTAKAAGNETSTIRKTTELSEQVLEQVQTGQRGAIKAVRKFMQSADRALPSRSDGPARRQELIDSALEMTERLVQVEYDFMRNVVHGAGETLSGSNGKK